MSSTALDLRTSVERAGPALRDELVSFSAPGSIEADQYRTLRQVVQRLSQDEALNVVAVTSPAPGDGKTVTTLNLAGALAQSSGARILVIDADLHRPSVAVNLGLDATGASGLEAAIRDQAAGTRSRAERRLDALNISVLLGGTSEALPYEVLGSPHLGALLADVRTRYDVVLLDMPPAVPLADCRMIARWVDGFILVVGAHRTPRSLLAEAIGVLDRSRIVGIVFNGDDRPLHPSHYGYYGNSRGPGRPAAAPSASRPITR